MDFSDFKCLTLFDPVLTLLPHYLPTPIPYPHKSTNKMDFYYSMNTGGIHFFKVFVLAAFFPGVFSLGLFLWLAPLPPLVITQF